jgi:class 3 adenylate cyclase
MARVSRIIVATEESYLGDDVLFEHAASLIEGLSALRASQLQTAPSLLCVRDRGAPMPSGNGALATYERWRRVRGEPRVIDLEDLRRGLRDSPARAATAASTAESAPPIAFPLASLRPERTLKILLFADISGFGRLHDAHAPLFHARFLSLVAQQLDACAVPPLEANTWGDALYVVFARPEQGAEFALRLLESMLKVDWTAQGLAETSQIRIALHAGPVFCGFDPIMGRDNYFGSSVTKTARIEPVTPPGTIYVSENFVATLAAEGKDHYCFEYMGRLELAKGYGESRIYRLERA